MADLFPLVLGQSTMIYNNNNFSESNVYVRWSLTAINTAVSQWSSGAVEILGAELDVD